MVKSCWKKFDLNTFKYLCSCVGACTCNSMALLKGPTLKWTKKCFTWYYQWKCFTMYQNFCYLSHFKCFFLFLIKVIQKSVTHELLSITILSAKKLALFIQGSSNPDLYFVILVEVFVNYTLTENTHFMNYIE